MYDFEIIWATSEDSLAFRNGVVNRPRMVTASRFELIERSNGSYCEFYDERDNILAAIYEMPSMIIRHERSS